MLYPAELRALCAAARMQILEARNGVITALLTSFLPHHIRRHPGIEVQLMEGSAARQRIQLERGETDLAIMPTNDARFPGRLLFPVHALAVVTKAHRLSRPHQPAVCVV